LPDATIKKGNQYMDVLTYTGDGTDNRAITGLNFQPDLAAFKTRNVTDNFRWVDAVRGVDKFFLSNTADAETTDATMVSSFNSNGITFGTDTNDRVNWSAKTYAAFAWKESVSAGFDIVTYTGSLTTTGSVAINHNLGVAPKIVISKSRNPNGADNGNWNVQVPVMGADKFLFLNTTQALLDSVSTGGGSRPIPTSTQFYTTWNSGSNISGNNYVAYLFSEVAGYSKFGSYTGNGSTDGPFVYLGFRPRWVMVKRTDAGGFDWIMQDTSRAAYNASDSVLFADLSNAEVNAGGYTIDVVSNGFKLRNSGGQTNASGGTYIYAAFAENPFKNSLAR